jgi:hypothetical protein
MKSPLSKSRPKREGIITKRRGMTLGKESFMFLLVFLKGK